MALSAKPRGRVARSQPLLWPAVQAAGSVQNGPLSVPSVVGGSGSAPAPLLPTLLPAAQRSGLPSGMGALLAAGSTSVGIASVAKTTAQVGCHNAAGACYAAMQRGRDPASC